MKELPDGGTLSDQVRWPCLLSGPKVIAPSESEIADPIFELPVTHIIQPKARFQRGGLPKFPHDGLLVPRRSQWILCEIPGDQFAEEVVFGLEWLVIRARRHHGSCRSKSEGCFKPARTWHADNTPAGSSTRSPIFRHSITTFRIMAAAFCPAPGRREVGESVASSSSCGTGSLPCARSSRTRPRTREGDASGVVSTLISQKASGIPRSRNAGSVPCPSVPCPLESSFATAEESETREQKLIHRRFLERARNPFQTFLLRRSR